MKMEGETDALGRFLFMYRSSPHDAGISPSELFLGRKMRTTLDLLKEKERRELQRDEPMEKEFNDHHGARVRSLSHNQPVYAKYHRKGGVKYDWLPGVIVECIGNVNFNVFVTLLCGRQKIIRCHANQLRPRTADDNTKGPVALPIDVIMSEPADQIQGQPLAPPRVSRRQPTRTSPPVLRSSKRT